MSSVALACLTSKQRAVIDREAALLASLLPAAAGDDGDIGARLRDTAGQLGVSVRTVQRRLRRFEVMGPAGLVDERLLKDTRRRVDPRWDEACVGELEEFTNQSTPSQQTVIRRATNAFLAGGAGRRRPVTDGRLRTCP